MKLARILILGTGFALLVISCANQPTSESELFRGFNLGELASRIDAPQIQASTGGSTFSSSFGETATKYRRTFFLEYHLDETEGSFDKQRFLSRLSAKAAEAIAETGAKIVETRQGDREFALTYTVEGSTGSIEVKAGREGSGVFQLTGEIREESNRQLDGERL